MTGIEEEDWLRGVSDKTAFNLEEGIPRASLRASSSASEISEEEDEREDEGEGDTLMPGPGGLSDDSSEEEDDDEEEEKRIRDGFIVDEDEDEEEEEERLEEEKRSELTILCRFSEALHFLFILSISSNLLQRRPSLKKLKKD